MVNQAHSILDSALINFQGKPIGSVAAADPNLEAENYSECFIRDFFPSALVFLAQGRYNIVRDFLLTVAGIRSQQQVLSGHERAVGLLPASFKVIKAGNSEKIVADFGDRAIGRVAPVDSALWWVILLRIYTRISADQQLRTLPVIRECLMAVIQLYLRESFETSPAMLVPDASFMIDRRMGVYGHPLEIQALFFGMLSASLELIPDEQDYRAVRETITKRMQALRSYMRIYYWMDLDRLNEIHRFRAEEFGSEATNVLNIYPESIPDWLDRWFEPSSGFFVGNLGASRMDFRFFALGNLLCAVFGIATQHQCHGLMSLYEHRWPDLMGHMPVKICYPALRGEQWVIITGCDPKNVAWSYHNGGNWPCLLWAFMAAATKSQRSDLSLKAFEAVSRRIHHDEWPEYYDGREGILIGRRSNFYQVWSAAAVILGHYFLEGGEEGRRILQALQFTE